MIGISVKGPSQEQKFVGIQTPCVLGRQADPANPDMNLSDPFASRRHIELKERDDGKLLKLDLRACLFCLCRQSCKPGPDDPGNYLNELCFQRSYPLRRIS